MQFLSLENRSWFIVLLFTVIGGICNFQWVEFVSVREMSKIYFDIESDSAITWSANLTTLLFVVMVFPVTVMFDSVQLRTTLVVASILNALGTFIKAVSRDNFVGMIIGQCFAMSTN